MNDDEDLFRDIARQVNGAHAELPEADDAPVALWQHIRSQYQSNREGDIMHVTASPFTQAIGVQPTPQRQHRSLRYFANVAATIAVVAMLALGGWFAAMNLRPTGDSNNGMAFAPATPDSAQTCDVEPLSVDRVMEIVKNPIRFMENGPAGEPATSDAPTAVNNLELYEAYSWTETPQFDGKILHPNQDQFDEIGTIADDYVNCLLFGTLGQAWTFYSPVHIQQEATAEFPVFANEADVRAYLEQNISQPAYLVIHQWEGIITRLEPAAVSINPDYQLAISRQAPPHPFSEVMSFGVMIQDAAGNPIYLTNGTGTVMVSKLEVSSYGVKINVGRDATSGMWYVVPYWW